MIWGQVVSEDEMHEISGKAESLHSRSCLALYTT